MRSRALKAWHVPQIFAALPLLLQGALALFLAGLIDFTLPLGKKLAIPTACIVGFILLFLIVTTVLPAFQALFLLFGFSPRGTVPTPCAYKSPQSHIFRKVTRYFLYSLSYVWPKTYLCETESWKYLANSEKILAPDKQRHLFPYIYTIWHPKSYAIADLQWLSLRDAWHNRVLDKDEDLYEHRKEEIRRNVFPLSDITQCLMSAISGPVNAKHTEEFLVAAFYCFEELSASIWSVEWSIKFRIDRRNEYFKRLQNLPNGSISTFFLHGGRYQYTGFPDRRTRFEAYLYLRRHRPLFHLDQICMFIDRLPTLTHLPPTILRRYQLEMKSRIIPYLLKGNIHLLTPTTDVDDSYYIHNLYVPYNESDAGFMSPSASVDTLSTLFSRLIFESTAPIYASRVGPTNPLYTHSSIPMVLDMLAGGIIFYLKMVSIETANVSPNAHVQQDLYSVGAAYRSTFFSVVKYLEAHGTSNSDTSLPTPVFYYAALLLHYLFCRLDVIDKDNILPTGSNFSEGLGVLFDAVSECKQRLASRRNDQLEMLFEESDLIQSRALGKDEFRDIPRFSDIWWDELFLGYQSLGLCSSQKTPFVATDGVTVPLSEPLPTDIPDSDLMSAFSMATSSFLDTVSPSSNTKHPDLDAAPDIRALEIDKGSIRINSRRATVSHSRPTSEFLGRDDILRDSTVGISSADSVIDMHPPS
ncbi:hypothetical protein BDN70DRAFT_43118 [Pholiota conissans]|uniref:DUF6535 domain-containing protein n=1 Tax=Pholiota conissans TaxID=109636 RepID=A0A9P6CZK5_9AGAR|nr:hypothetical protein BDN70DRAFT_43118 [Pholiota conissans]